MLAEPRRIGHPGTETGLILVALAVVGGVLRMVGLGDQSLWFDEALSAFLAAIPIRDLPETILTEGLQHSPLYYLLLRPFAGSGTSEFRLRLLSVLFSTATIPLLAGLAARRFGRWPGVLAGLMLALSPMSIWYARETRMYAMLALVSVGAHFSFVAFLEDPSARRRLFSLWFFLTVGLYTHHFAFFFPLVQLVFFLLTFRRNYGYIRKWALVLGMAGLAYLPWIVIILLRGEYYFASGTGARPMLITPLVTFVNFTSGFVGRFGWLELALLAISLLLVMQSGRMHLSPDLLMLYLSIAVPIVVTFGISFRFPMYLDRYLIIALPSFLLLLGVGLVRIEPLRLRWLLGLVLTAGMAIGAGRVIAGQENFRKADWRGMIEYMKARDAFQGRNIYTRNFQDLFLFHFYDAPLESITPLISFDQVVIPPPEQLAREDGLWLVLPLPQYSLHYLSGCLVGPPDLGPYEPVRKWYEEVETERTELIEFECLRLEYYGPG